VETPKSGKSRRVDMSNQLTATLKDLRVQRKRQALKNGWGSVPDSIFVNTLGESIDLDNWRGRIFNKALEKAELRRIRIHDLRHTYATIRISKGDNIQDVSKQLGHHSTKLTLDVYSHCMPRKKKAEVDALDDRDFMHPNAPPLHPPTKKELTSVG
jgi:integrase